MPFLVTMLRRWVLVAVALPLAGKLLGHLASRIRARRGESGVTKALDSASRAASRKRRREKH
ncbi:hypothetical protein [uncultured Pseudokineococcus sp.]|uniref:hypothetical protein n=1 Tax=uncultured Pseudokineococcus sp. TaxID=1642928 RepID=UPI002637D589|nr:hypothetical protein [uncultured Pseudokineococcus sp.]